MRKLIFILFATALMASCGPPAEKASDKEQKSASDATPKAPSGGEVALTTRDKFDAIVARYDEADDTPDKQADVYAREMMDLIAADPKDEVAFGVFNWVTTNARESESRQEILDHLAEHFRDDARLGGICLNLPGMLPLDESLESYLRSIASTSENESVKAKALYAVSEVLGRAQQLKIQIDGAQVARDQIVQAVGQETYDYVTSKSEDDTKQQLTEILTTLDEQHADVVLTGNRTIGPLVAEKLYEIRYLSKGSEALEISDVDLDGVEFKLSDYRGKVVLLDFWGDW